MTDLTLFPAKQSNITSSYSIFVISLSVFLLLIIFFKRICYVGTLFIAYCSLLEGATRECYDAANESKLRKYYECHGAMTDRRKGLRNRRKYYECCETTNMLRVLRKREEMRSPPAP